MYLVGIYEDNCLEETLEYFETEEEAREYINSHLNSFDLEDNQTLGYQKE